MKRETPVIRELLSLAAAFLEDLRVQKDLGSPGYDLSPEALTVLERWKEGAGKAAPPRPSPSLARSATETSERRDFPPAASSARPAPSPARSAVRASEASAVHGGIKVLFVSDGPVPALGEAGILLNKIIQAMGLSDGDWKVADLNGGIEGEKGSSNLDESFKAVNPKAVCLLGEKATRAILGGKTPFPALAGRFHETSLGPALPTWHPSTILACRFPEEEKQVKSEVWKHMRLIMKKAGLSAPKPQRKNSAD